MAIVTRWRIPPDNWCGYSRMRRAGAGMPTWRRRSSARARATFFEAVPCTTIGSMIWSPIRRTGFSALRGFCDTMPTRVPRVRRIATSSARNMSTPATSTVPERVTSARANAPTIERRIIVLPEPDSPTTPSASPGATSSDTPSTACTSPAGVCRVVWRSAMWSTASSVRDRCSPSTRSRRCVATTRGEYSWRRPSPTRLNARIVTNITVAGIRATCPWRSMSPVPSAISLPHVVSSSDRPTKASPPSATMTSAKPMNANDSTGMTMLGASSRTSTRRRVAPIDSAASTNSRSDRANAAPRTMRA